MFLRAQSSYSLLLLIGQIFIINILHLPNYLLWLAQIEAICIHKEPVLISFFPPSFPYSFFGYLFFTFSFPSSLCLLSWGCPGKTRRREGEGWKKRKRKAVCMAVKSATFGISEVCICFLPLGHTHSALQTSAFSLHYGDSRMGSKDCCRG